MKCLPSLLIVLALFTTIHAQTIKRNIPYAGVDDEKRALHDRVCDTRVIYKQSVA